MKTHSNIPIFIPHLGCRMKCVFCSQTKITGVDRAEPELGAELKRVENIIESSLDTLGNDAEIAFFGGSFTGIGEERMTALLEKASGYLGGKIKGIRCSTRPDYIDRHICDILKKYGVTSVELGVQSTSQKVLDVCRRGHTVEDSEKAIKLLKEYGFETGGQMMVGLPGSTADDEVKTARDIVSFGADTTRIYPTVVFENTPLYDMTLSGEYTPLSIEDASARCASCARVFIESGVKILRIGLYSSENMTTAPFGANHPAMGELAEGEIYYSMIRDIAEKQEGSELTLLVPKGSLSKCIGHGGRNRERLSSLGKTVRFVETDGLKEYDVRIKN